MLLKDFADLVEMFVEEILFLVMAHPNGKKRAAAADDSRDAIAHHGEEFAKHAGVDGHVIHALLGLLFDDFEHDINREIFSAAHARDGFIDRHGADRDGRSLDDSATDFGNVAARGEIHRSVRSVMDGSMELFELFVNVGSGGRIANVRIDFAFEGDADAHRFEVAMMDVGGDDGAAASDFAADKFGVELFAFGDVGHLLGDDAEARKVHLGDV